MYIFNLNEYTLINYSNSLLSYRDFNHNCSDYTTKNIIHNYIIYGINHTVN
jgi:hypothetical protein